ncbi:acyltransferase family protein [Comamonas sp. J-3]|uniref:acyltransferase family protein n=1 Tax=Comamonas trifloxystrobinivorans TaxID=3350256 RepID=UPI00372CD411
MHQSSRASSHRRFHNIDALRAIAALLVVCMHTSEVFVPLMDAGQVSGRWLYTIARSLEFGSIGVVVFFAISGFVIPASLRGTSRLAALRDFSISRLFRLYPAFWVSILPGAYTFYWMWGRPFSLQDLLLNLTMVPQLLGAQPAEGLYWTLSIELAFYLLCMLLFALGWLHRTRHLIGACFALLLLFCIFRRSDYANGFAHLSTMFFGAMYRQFLDSQDRHTRRQLGAAIGIVLFFWLVFMPGYGVWAIATGLTVPEYSRFFLSYAIGIVLFSLALVLPAVHKGILTWLGSISYSIYLLHPVVFYPILWVTLHSPRLQALQLHVGVFVLVSMALTIAVATVNYHLVEKPAIRLGRRLQNQFS